MNDQRPQTLAEAVLAAAGIIVDALERELPWSPPESGQSPPPRPVAPSDQTGHHSGRLWFNTGQAAEYASHHPITLLKALNAGELHGEQRMKGGRWVIRRECLDAWLSKKPCEHTIPERR